MKSLHRNRHCIRTIGQSVLACALVFASGCARNESGENTAEQTAVENNGTEAGTEKETVQFTDDLGQNFEIEQPERTAVLIGSFADEWIDAGGKDSLVAAAHDSFTSFGISEEGIEDLGEIKAISLEKLLASDPDLVIASAKNESQKDLQSQLEEASIPVAYFDVSDFDDYLRTLKIFTDLTGDQQAYESAGTAQQNEIEDAIAQRKDCDTPTVLYLRATGSGVKSKNSKDTVLGEMLADLNTENLADHSDSLLDTLSAEAILDADPDAIFIVYQGSDDTKARQAMDTALMSSEAWNSLYAVQNDQVYVMDQRLYNLKPNDEWGKAYSDLADILDQITLRDSQ